MSKPTPPASPALATTPAEADPWTELRRFTSARIALGHAGAGLPTAAHLAFQADHAAARDAVHHPLDTDRLRTSFEAEGWPSLLVTSQAHDRATYLRRPDLGRRLSDTALSRLSEPMARPEVALMVVDGLSSAAIEANALPTLQALIPLLRQAGRRIGPIIVATQGRVALGDHVGEIVQADVMIVLIGERPGLSASGALGLYLTWMPRVGRVDAERNCISNLRDGGLSPALAARQAADLVEAMTRHRAAGIALARKMALPGLPSA